MKQQDRYTDKLEELQAAGNFRSFPYTDASILELSSNDYLGLNNDETLYADFLKEFNAKQYKLSACSSRLLSGNVPEYAQLENLISSAYQAEACLLYNSGYHANMGILSAIAGKKDLIIADKLVHASIIDGVRLSDATVMRYKHLDYKHLENLLEKNRTDYENIFIVSESIFSMDGDMADLKKMVELKKKYNCYLYIDEAHAIGVRGKNGLGCVEEANLIPEFDFIIATFGKALASVGAFVVCSQVFKDYLINFSRTIIFTTALPPINIAWTSFLFQRLPEFSNRRENLSKLSKEFAELMQLKSDSHIIPLIIGENKDAIAASQKLKAKGFNVLPIRYPTVPKGTARLRFSLGADMKIEDLKEIKEILGED